MFTNIDTYFTKNIGEWYLLPSPVLYFGRNTRSGKIVFITISIRFFRSELVIDYYRKIK